MKKLCYRQHRYFVEFTFFLENKLTFMPPLQRKNIFNILSSNGQPFILLGCAGLPPTSQQKKSHGETCNRSGIAKHFAFYLLKPTRLVLVSGRNEDTLSSSPFSQPNAPHSPVHSCNVSLGFWLTK